MLEQAQQAEAAQQSKTAGVIATFAKRAKESALAKGAPLEYEEIATTAGAADVEPTFADATTMQE
jgi:hypothetical protein